ncbi:MAG: EscU/YscU/HrcU family type III secretion system export apparatus switch protein [Myxococcales bacterium]
MAEARVYPPSEHRIAEARRAGLAPRTSFVALAAGLAVGGLWFEYWGGALLQGLSQLWRVQLAAFERAEVPDAGAALRSQLPQLLWPLACAFVVYFVLALGLSFVAQGSARFLPMRRRTRAFPPVPAPASGKALWVLAVFLASLGALHEWVRVRPDTAHLLAARWWFRLSALAALIGVFDALLARLVFVRALWLTRREHLDEQREAYGAPELRTARARARHASDAP